MSFIRRQWKGKEIVKLFKRDFFSLTCGKNNNKKVNNYGELSEFTGVIYFTKLCSCGFAKNTNPLVLS